MTNYRQNDSSATTDISDGATINVLVVLATRYLQTILESAKRPTKNETINAIQFFFLIENK